MTEQRTLDDSGEAPFDMTLPVVAWWCVSGHSELRVSIEFSPALGQPDRVGP